MTNIEWTTPEELYDLVVDKIFSGEKQFSMRISTLYQVMTRGPVDCRKACSFAYACGYIIRASYSQWGMCNTLVFVREDFSPHTDDMIAHMRMLRTDPSLPIVDHPTVNQPAIADCSADPSRED